MIEVMVRFGVGPRYDGMDCLGANARIRNMCW